jgi:hypothetical protein
VGFVEAQYADDAQKNLLCAAVPFPNHVNEFPRSVLASMTNQFRWSQDPKLRTWIRHSRLDGFGKLIAELDPADAEKQAIMARFKACAGACMANLPKLVAAQAL